MTGKEGRKFILDKLLVVDANNIYIRLAKNNPSGAPEDVTFADLTEATFAGYSAIHAPAFPSATLNGSDQGETISPTLTWTSGGGVSGTETIYGLYVDYYDGSFVSHLLEWVPFAAPITISMDGQTIEKKLRMVCGNLVP